MPLVATNDLHYTLKEDAKPHDVLLCIQQQKLQSDPKRLQVRLGGVLPEDRRGDAPASSVSVPEACDQTLRIAERAELDLVYGDAAPPTSGSTSRGSRPPEGKDRDAYLPSSLVDAGAARTLRSAHPPRSSTGSTRSST